MRYIFTLMLFVLCMVNSYAEQILLLDKTSSIPAEEGKYASLKDLEFCFDFSNLSLQENQTYGLTATMTKKIQLQLYKGTPSEGELIASIKYSIYDDDEDFNPGSNVITIPLDQEYILEPDQVYSLLIPTPVFDLIDVETYDIIATNEEEVITFYGGTSSDNELIWVSTTPQVSTSIDCLETISLSFNQDILIAEGAKATLYENEDVLEVAALEVDQNDSKICNIKFNNTILYYSHKYRVEIPEDCINTSEGKKYGKITLDYNGSSYKEFSYGRIYPKDNSEISYLAIVKVPVNCSTEEYLGRDFKAVANLYKISDDESIQVGSSLNCEVMGDAKGFFINVYNLDLEPSSTYQLIVDADQFHLWSYETDGALKDTGNEKLVLTYTTPETIVLPEGQQFGESIPSTDEPLNKLNSFKLGFDKFIFDDEYYYPVFTSYDEGYNVLKVVDQTTNEEFNSFEVDIKWDTNNNYWLENINPLDITLLDGHIYNVVVPAGMFCCYFEPLQDVSLNKEYIVSYNGSYATSFDVSCNFGDAFTITNVVNRGESTTLTFSPAEDWAIDEVIVNDETKTVEDNTLIIPDVNEETNVYVTYKYAGEISFDYETGVDNVMGECPYSISMEPGYVIISNVELGATIDVYNTVGMLMATSTATQSTMKLGVNPGIVVVVIRDGDNTPVGITVKVPQ